jgi:hypothetical protein
MARHHTVGMISLLPQWPEELREVVGEQCWFLVGGEVAAAAWRYTGGLSRSWPPRRVQAAMTLGVFASLQDEGAVEG